MFVLSTSGCPHKAILRNLCVPRLPQADLYTSRERCTTSFDVLYFLSRRCLHYFILNINIYYKHRNNNNSRASTVMSRTKGKHFLLGISLTMKIKMLYGEDCHE
jgi:hypothetical protein